MTTVIDFSKAQKEEAQNNLSAFIKKNKANFIFPNNNWDNNIWDITNFIKNKLINSKSKKVYFRSVKDNAISKNNIDLAISKPLIDFTKATFCEIMRIKKLSEFKRIIYAIQALEFALLEQNKTVCITEIDFETLHIAESYFRSKYKDPWIVAKVLESIINNIVIKNQINLKIHQWSTTIIYKNPIRNDRTQKNHIDGSKSKIPHLEEILALAEIYHSSTYIPDKLVTCFIALAMFAPSRGSEILTLPLDCITKVTHGNEEIMGIQWLPLKGGEPLTKFAVNKEYEVLATDTVNYLIELGQPARKAALWYKDNPNKLYLPPNFEHLRNQPITLWEVAQILGKENSITGCHAYRYGFTKPIGKTTDRGRMLEKKVTG